MNPQGEERNKVSSMIAPAYYLEGVFPLHHREEETGRENLVESDEIVESLVKPMWLEFAAQSTTEKRVAQEKNSKNLSFQVSTNQSM